MELKRFSILCALGLALGITSIAAATPHPPDINPANFPGGPVTNPYFPLLPGTTFYYVGEKDGIPNTNITDCLLYTSPSPRDGLLSRMPSSA